MWVCLCVRMYQSWAASLNETPNKEKEDLFYIKILTVHPLSIPLAPLHVQSHTWGDEILGNLV